MKPIVLVAGPTKGGFMHWTCVRFSIWLHGGVARLCRAGKSPYIGEFHALLLGGGADVHPSLYGEDPQDIQFQKTLWTRIKELLFFPITLVIKQISKSSGYDSQRDSGEIALLEQALKSGLPVLGLCRGHQLISVHFGGVLFQDISQQIGDEPEAQTIFPRKPITISPESLLSRIVKVDTLSVNALHRQVIRKVGEGLRISAINDRGVIQATEDEERQILTLQFHPEYMPYIKEHRAIYDWLVRSAKSKATNS